jgi:general secretion pathway protein A
VQRLLRTEAANGGWLTMIASANTAQLGRLGKGVLELVDLRIDLAPWDELDTIGYLQLALFEAGAERPLFDDQAMTELHRAAAGVPRGVNRLAEFALLAGAEHSQEIVDASAVEAAGAAINLSIPELRS